MSMSTANMQELTRSEIWSNEIKEILRDELMAQKYVRMLDFPDGDLHTIPSIGQSQVDDYVEDTPVIYRPMDLGEFQFQITEYKSSGTYITKKAMQDAYYSAQLISRFVPEQSRAMMVSYETDILSKPEEGVTANSNEAIDGFEHRWAGGATGGFVQLEDFIRAKYVLDKQKVPVNGRVALVDPSVEVTLNKLTNLVNVSNNPRFEGIVNTGMATGNQFISNIYGFDVYTSNYLANATDSALNDESDTAVDFSSDNGKVNLFFSADSSVTPFVGSWRQQPEVDYGFNKDFQRHEYLTTARWGVKLYRPENMVRVITKTNV